MEKNEALEQAFQRAVESINNHTDPFPADVLLKLYAYYKRATGNEDMPSGSKPLINAFKANALFQSQDLTEEEAKRLYIDAVDRYFLYRK
ncbi:acyl-CoA-binding protein [Aureitalea marina]|uniref:Acyl-CoA-binding protein n=1 Tax=Aureitalea marina TaxID=930804 RepID=A0A2S7KMF0_9FLAO|nr:acyl-CoA-binding protein [Aureitalea marina]PQB03771.1 acyl-CoA-binding protein [Aureitalea marina]